MCLVTTVGKTNSLVNRAELSTCVDVDCDDEGFWLVEDGPCSADAAW